MANHLKQLDYPQVIRSVYDPDTNRLRVDAGTGPGGQVEVIITHEEDSIRIGDGTDLVEVTADGEMQVRDDDANTSLANIDQTLQNIEDILNADTSRSTINTYNEANAVPSATLTTIATYTVPAISAAFLQRVDVSGENIALYEVKLNGSTIAKKRSYFTKYNEDFIFESTALGLDLIPGDVITAEVTHNRPTVADFNARIQVVEIA